MIISIGGTIGSGKSTIGKKLEKILGYKRHYIGCMKRQIAADLGISLAELNTRDEEEFFSDKIVDERIVELANTQDNIIIEGRTAFHFAPKSLKLFFYVDPDIGVRRIWKDVSSKKRPTEQFESLAEMKEANAVRMRSDRKRYLKWYKIDCFDKRNFDIVIDTTNKPIPVVLKETLEKLKAAGIP